MSERIFTPSDNTGLNCFVFGSNENGWHGAGAALEAKRHWGAKQGIGLGRTGMSYAIPTKDRNIKTRPLLDIQRDVFEFLDYARKHPEITFLVTRIGCGLASLTDADIAPMFAHAPSNCVLPNGWGNLNNRIIDYGR